MSNALNHMSSPWPVLGTAFFGYVATGAWDPERGTNLVDSGAPFYDVYRTADGRWLSVAAIEPAFYQNLVGLLGLSGDLPAQHDRAAWPAMKERVAAAVAQRTLDEWMAAAAGVEACIAPVLEPTEAAIHPHNAERRTFVDHGGIVQPAPAPRFGRTPVSLGRRPPRPGAHTTEALVDWGVAPEQVALWCRSGAIGQNVQESEGGGRCTD